ncbi:class I SAM-dependent methyltransferase [Portibacter marinus]|uniref:class I SAM-dependent methyltransferase n=1 Tax=Portibacter marinus TaxID=2898660 RepID=UPI001F3B4932|nr:methyltransferase domain-containing protein [Portibacter marinus]
MELKRRPFQGVLNILDFNRHFYYYGLAALALLLVVIYAIKLPTIISVVLIVGFMYGLLMPLIVSAYVYDFSGYYSLKWLDHFIEDKSLSSEIVNINAGFDETSYIIKDKFKNAELQVYDFYDEELHTEAAIVRARKVSLVYPNTEQIKSNSIPKEDESTDIVFLLSSAHEIREFPEKVEFLKECYRICKPNGKVIMVEHLRDFPNFLAFTVGFNHFFSKRVWKKAFISAGFASVQEKKFTPFMSIFECTL